MAKYLNKILTNITSIKLWVFVVACVFFDRGTLNQDGWIVVVLSVVGFRTVNEGLAVYAQIKSPKPAAEAVYDEV